MLQVHPGVNDGYIFSPNSVMLAAPTNGTSTGGKKGIRQAHARAFHHCPHFEKLRVDLRPAHRMAEHHQRPMQVDDCRDVVPFRSVLEMDESFRAPLRKVDEVQRSFRMDGSQRRRYFAAVSHPIRDLGINPGPHIHPWNTRHLHVPMRSFAYLLLPSTREHMH